MDATVRQLAAYAAVARAKSFTAAAAQLHVSQSSLSRTVAELERSLGAQLLERDTRNVTLTPTGVETLRVADEVLNAHRAGMQELERFACGEAGTVAVSTLPSIAAVLLPSVLARFRSEHPRVAVQIMDGLERAVLQRVSSGDADFAITTVGGPAAHLEHRPWVRDRFVAVLPQQHPLATREELTWRELAAEPLLAVGRDSSARRLADAAFAQVDVPATPAAEAGSIATVGGLVAAGLGVAAMPALVLPLMAADAIVHRPLVEPVVDRRLELVQRSRRPLTAAGRHFLDTLEHCRGDDAVLPAGVSWA